MSARASWDGAAQFFSIIAVWDEGFVEFGHLAKTNIAYFRELLQCYEYLMPHIEDRLVGTANSFCGIVNGIAMHCVTYGFAPCFRREMGVRHNGMGSWDKGLSTSFTVKPLFPAFMPIADDSMGVTIGAVRFHYQGIFSSMWVAASNKDAISSSESRLRRLISHVIPSLYRE